MGNNKHRVSAEVALVREMHSAEVAAYRDFQAELLALLKARESTVDLTEKILAGIKAILVPELAPLPVNDMFTEAKPPAPLLAADPAFEIAPEDWEWSESMRETLKREEAEDG